MTLLDDHTTNVSDLTSPAGGEIVAVANAATAAVGHTHDSGVLVIVARTASGEHLAVTSDSGPLRAAVSVAVASGHTRLWDGAVGTDTVERSVQSLPEVVRTTAEAHGVTGAHVGAIIDDTVAAVAVWFEVDGAAPTLAQRSETMALLSAAAERQREFFAERATVQAAAAKAASEAAAAASSALDHSPAGREFDPSDPGLDSETGLATSDRFHEALDSYESDEATLVVVDLDGFSAVADEHGAAVADTILRVIADRLVSSCRSDDLVARIGPDAFAVLFADAPRSVGLHVAKRLLDTIALPLDLENGPESVTATVALAHQFGLVDTEELLESAEDALQSGKRSGAGRLVIAS